LARVFRYVGSRFLACLICAVMVLSALPVAAYASTPYLSYSSNIITAPNINAPYAAVFSSDGTILWSRNADTQVPMASTTKILTTIVVLEHTCLDNEVTVSAYAADQEPTSAGLYEGQTLTVRDLLYGLLLASGNDAAVALAEYVGGSVEGFAALMNEKALQLGMTNSHFVTPNGLEDPEHYTTVSDYTKLTVYAMQNTDFRTIINSTRYSFSDTRGVSYTYKNANELLTNSSAYASSSDALGTVVGLKTGFTDEAGYCLVSAADNKNIEMYAIVFGDSSAWWRFEDSARLLEWGFSHINNVQLIAAKTTVGTYACKAWPNKTIDVVVGNTVNASVYDYGGNVTCTVTLKETTQALHAGDTVGTITWYQAGKTIAQAPLCIVEDVPTPGFFESIGIWFSNLFSTITGHATQSTSTLSINADLTVNTIN
jgi:serine-type D-Ala-D-Ala carboxypeptidase (penicillin-binding protein 5/6)